MEGMPHDHGGMMSPPMSTSNTNSTGGMMNHGMSHMTFFWGENSEILFSGWPGTSEGMYALALVCVFVAAVLVEWLSHSRFVNPAAAADHNSNHSRVAAGLIQTLVHGIRVGLAFLVMLAVMSFNVGVLLVAVAGHALGFLVFGSMVFNKSPPPSKPSDLSPVAMSC